VRVPVATAEVNGPPLAPAAADIAVPDQPDTVARRGVGEAHLEGELGAAIGLESGRRNYRHVHGAGGMGRGATVGPKRGWFMARARRQKDGVLG
jgi:hypothetical protein